MLRTLTIRTREFLTLGLVALVLGSVGAVALSQLGATNAGAQPFYAIGAALAIGFVAAAVLLHLLVFGPAIAEAGGMMYLPTAQRPTAVPT